MTTTGGSTAGSAPAADGIIAVTASDYHFDGVPATIKAGSKLTFTNSSTKEFHELVVIRLPATETAHRARSSWRSATPR